MKAAEVALKTEKAQVEAEKQEARARTAADQASAREFHKERAAIVAAVAPPTYQRYERARKARKGIGVAEAVDGRCTGCNLSMRLQFYQDLKRGNEILACECCQRILYYNPPVPVEDLAGEPAPAPRE